MSYDNPWLFNGKVFETENIEGTEGFVYLIVDKTNGKKYVGRKYFFNLRKPAKGKRRVRSDSDWKNYYGSSPELTLAIKEKGVYNFTRYILSLHKTRGDVNYEEIKQQFLRNVLEDDTYYNGNINGKWHTKPQHIIEARRYNEDSDNL